MNSDLFTAIRTQLLTVTGMKYVAMWNNQFMHVEDRSNFAFPFPCAFVEFVDVRPEQFGNGVQIYEPLVVRIHWGWEKYNEPDKQDEVLEQHTFIQSIQAKLQGFKADNSSSFVRVAEVYDYDHTDLSVGTLDYTLTYIDRQQELPIGNQLSTPPTELIVETNEDNSFDNSFDESFN